MNDKIRLGYIGLGVMGGQMSKRLLKEGYDITVFDIDQSKLDEFKTLGAVISVSPKELASTCDIVFTSLPFPATVEEAYLGSGGILEGSSSDTILIDMSTVSPETTRGISEVAEEKGIKYLDAPVSGGFKEAGDGTLTIIVGGDEVAFESAKDVLNVLGANVYYVGDSGAGNTVKLVNNVMSMGNVLVAAEAFVMGLKAGIDGQTLFNILSKSAGRSFHFIKRWPNILARNFEAGFTVDLAKKDLGLAVDMAKGMTVPVPATSLIHQLYTASSARGDGGKDFAVIIKLFEEWAQVEAKNTKEQ